tara:strand:+ start:269 stop:1192 length:924 start_codon:yes stop_codon:yes gene_type:complete
MYQTNIIHKIRKFINNRVLRTPGVEFLKKKPDLSERKRHINFWLGRAKKKTSFKKFFFSDVDEGPKKIDYKFLEKEKDFPRINQSMFNSLSNNGILVIENALPEKERKLIIDFFQDLKDQNYKKNRWLKKPTNPGFFEQVNEIMGETKINNFKTLNNLSNQFSKEIYGKIVEPTVQLRYLNQQSSETEEKTKGATYLHTDRFLPHFKIYYSPFEITIKDAPLEYLISSHKINDDFVNFYLNAKSFDETDKLFEKFDLQRKIVCVPENSLYVAFTNGFHRRTVFNGKSDRSLLFLQFVQRFNKLDYLI